VASIIKTPEGSYRAFVRRTGARALSKTFKSKTDAQRWARQTEAAIEAGTAVKSATGATVGDAITAYIQLREEGQRPINPQGNETYMLRWLERDLGDDVISGIKPQRLATYCTRRAKTGAGAYTIGMEISKLGTVLKYSAMALGEAFPDIVGQARPLLDHLGLIGPGKSRERRPTVEELAAVKAEAPPLLRDIIDFAIATCMRRGEIVRIKWADVDEASSMLTIRDRKDPRRKRDERIPLLGDALAIIKRQPKSDDDDRVFPISPEWISDYFLLACRVAKVEDLKFHDLRHEGVSRLFESGLRIEQVALVSGHKSWSMLKRYTQLKPESLLESPAPQ
jgi:integrase